LIVIDVQNDFCPQGALAVEDGNAIVPAINKLMSTYPIKVLTQDWHPRDHSSFADNHEGGEPFSMIEMPYGPQVLWPRHCVQGSIGAALHEGLNVDAADMIIRKGFRSEIDSYSAFFENDKETKTGLTGYLRDRGVSHVVLCGLATDFCVYYSAIDAIAEGFKVTVLVDCTRAIDLDGSLAKAMTDMEEKGVMFATSDTV
jgi:nicotinamidase/pyrazinamidase